MFGFGNMSMQRRGSPLKVFGITDKHIPHALFIRATGIVPPPPPYIIAATDYSTVSALDVSYVATDGPSAISTLFRIIAGGLSPAAGNIVVTPSANIAVWDGSTWNSAPFNVAYTDSGIDTATIYGVRFNAGFSAGTYTETLTLSGGDAPDWIITVTCEVTAVPTARMYEYYHYI